MQVAQAEYQRLIHDSETRAQSANSLTKAERERARAVQLECELARQELKSALMRRSEQEELATEREWAAKRQQAGETLKVSFPRLLLLLPSVHSRVLRKLLAQRYKYLCSLVV